MKRTASKPLKIFCSYSHRDEKHLNKLKRSLAMLRREGLIQTWDDREIDPGQEWDEIIAETLETSEIILLLISPDFMDSYYAYEKEMKRAIERHERGDARVIPIIVRPTLWKRKPLSKLQALPKNAKPITEWANRDRAWFNVAEGIGRVVEKLADQLERHITVDQPPESSRTEVTTPQSEHKVEANDTLESKLEIHRLNEKVGDHFLQHQLHLITRGRSKFAWINSLSILIIDIDDLTVINKQYGQEVGDNVLWIIGDMIQKVTKAKYFGRCGEDTFFSVLLDCNLEDAKLVAERLRINVKGYPWSTLANFLRVTCSIGVAQLRYDAERRVRYESAESLAVRASIGMNEAKIAGRNRVKCGPKYLSRNQSLNLRNYYS